MTLRRALGRLGYGALFVVVLPTALVAWARATEEVVRIPALRLPGAGTVLMAAGGATVVASMIALWVWGGGLPMNAFPPPRFVERGPYRFLRHPIYVGFGAVCAGAALVTGSASGLWMVTPVTLLSMAALVAGYEAPDLRRRFGPVVASGRPLLSLPRSREGPPTPWERASVVLLVFLPWLVAFEAVVRMGVPADAVEAYLPFERGWPVRVGTEAVYATVYPFVILVPLLVRRSDVARRFAVQGLLATGLVTLVYVTLPLVAPPRPFEGGGIWGTLLALERASGHTVAAFPSFHVVWTLLAADAWASDRTPPRRWPWVWAGAIAASCITTGMHALADVVVAVPAWWLVRSHRGVWEALRRGAERVAASWREWRWGPVRLLSYGFFGALAGGVGAWITASLAGPGQRGGVAILLAFSLLGAGLWAQKLEGSPALSRPFGYFGSLVGAAAGAVVAGGAGYDTSLLFAAVAASAPWVQGLGRLRCLVQGCCHGREAPEVVAIRYRDPRSRVCAHAGLTGRPLHPTPLYSLLANLVVGVLVARLWAVGASEGLVIGLYLALAGLARFVEESYRGEPQTPLVGGLRLYQWLAVVLLVAGAVVTGVAPHAVPPTAPSAAPGVVGGGVLFGLVCLFALGVDFPGSGRRFARLAPVS